MSDQPPAFPPPGGSPVEGGPPPTQAGGLGAGAQPPAPYGGAALATSGYPIDFRAEYPEGGIARWRPFVQGVYFPLLALPHYVVLWFLWIAAGIAGLVSWFAVLITGRYPRGLFDFVAGTLRWTYRVAGFTYLLTDQYPPFSLGEEPQYPIRVDIPYPERIARWRPLVQWLAAIPHYIALYFVSIGAFVVYIIAWFALVFTRTYPQGMFDFLVGFHRWQARYYAYTFWMTEEYPPFGLR